MEFNSDSSLDSSSAAAVLKSIRGHKGSITSLKFLGCLFMAALFISAFVWGLCWMAIIFGLIHTAAQKKNET